MKYIQADIIRDAINTLYDRICCEVDDGVVAALKSAEEQERGKLCRFALNIMNQNLALAKNEHIAACQDTGMAVVFLEIGQDVHIQGDIESAVNEGVRLAYNKHYRKSVLDPVTRINTKDNTPAVIHYEIVKGDRLKISVMAKGFGSENMSRVYMLTPADGVEGIRKAILETVIASGGCACPPIIVGVGVGGTMEKAAILSKKALLREIGSSNSDSSIAKLEKEILDDINRTGIGAQGLNGDITALAVFIDTYPTHIAGLPVAINIQCHCSRHDTIIIEGSEL